MVSQVYIYLYIHTCLRPDINNLCVLWNCAQVWTTVIFRFHIFLLYTIFAFILLFLHSHQKITHFDVKLFYSLVDSISRKKNCVRIENNRMIPCSASAFVSTWVGSINLSGDSDCFMVSFGTRRGIKTIMNSHSHFGIFFCFDWHRWSIPGLRLGLGIIFSLLRLFSLFLS